MLDKNVAIQSPLHVTILFGAGGAQPQPLGAVTNIQDMLNYSVRFWAQVVLSRSHLGLVMEYMPGGNLVDYVQSMRKTRDQRGGLCLSEEEARWVLYFFIFGWVVAAAPAPAHIKMFLMLWQFFS